MSKNKTLDIIISKYTSLCASKNIDIFFNLKTADLSDIDDLDLSTILNNILDNAIESVAKSEKKKITVDIYKKLAFEIIRIKNSCNCQPKSKNGKLVTIKEDKTFHGLGLQSVERT